MYLDLSPCLKRSRLAARRGSIALDAWVGGCDCKGDSLWDIHSDDDAIPANEGDSISFLDPFSPGLIPLHPGFFIGLVVHENYLQMQASHLLEVNA